MPAFSNCIPRAKGPENRSSDLSPEIDIESRVSLDRSVDGAPRPPQSLPTRSGPAKAEQSARLPIGEAQAARPGRPSSAISLVSAAAGRSGTKADMSSLESSSRRALNARPASRWRTRSVAAPTRSLPRAGRPANAGKRGVAPALIAAQIRDPLVLISG